MAETQQTADRTTGRPQHWLASDFVRLTIIMIRALTTANYLGIFKQSIDVTFFGEPASTAASYRLFQAVTARRRKREKSVIVDKDTSALGIK